MPFGNFSSRLFPIQWLLLLLLVCLSPLAVLNQSLADDDVFPAEAIEYFENKIRPLLVDKCLECHGADKSESGLRLDSRESILAGGDSDQPGAIAGEPDKSLIILSVRHQSDFEMPPTDPLNQQQIEDLSHWIKIGMPWPTATTAISKVEMPELMANHRGTHWSFQPIVKPEIPAAENFTANESLSDLSGDPANISQLTSIDRLLLKNLKSKGLDFSPAADRRTLIRRATFDLIGLPPTYEDVQQFVHDETEDAYAQLIDRLLDSPQYGERWARHWLDVARYADTRGYTFNDADRNFPFAFTYRDYVIDALNSDLPYDQFIRQQLAADYLDVPDDKRTLAALGFLMVGRKFIAREDTIDDQVDVVTRGLMGLTVSCARCHDHKYDAISTEDYYSLYGVFGNCHEPKELPLIGSVEQRDDIDSFLAELEKLQQDVKVFEDDVHHRVQTHIDEHLPDYLAHASAADQPTDDLPILRKEQLNEYALHRWRHFLVQRATEGNIYKPMADLYVLPNDGFEVHAKKLIEHWAAMPAEEQPVQPLLLEAFQKSPPKSKAEIGLVYGTVLRNLKQRWVDGGSKQPPVSQFLPTERELASPIFFDKSPANVRRSKITDYYNAADKKEVAKLETSIGEHHANSPDGINRAMTIRENEHPHNERVMLRGNIDRRGDEVPRQFVALIDPQRKPFKNRAGRLELAEAIANPKNPLTARVFVNRVWMHHFSKPLVSTPSDFGIRCEQPLQHELLDFLAADFIEHGWSIKHLHRQIMLSRAYRQSSQSRPECDAIDPENQLIWKMNRRRLEFEAVRDSMLLVSGDLDHRLHGKSVDLFGNPPTNRRTIYGKIDRQDLPNLLRVFDLASPDQSSASRIRTIVPQQSLFLMNSRFAVLRSKSLANVVATVKPNEQADENKPIQKLRIRKLYQTVFQRNPTQREIEIGQQFVQAATVQWNEEKSKQPSQPIDSTTLKAEQLTQKPANAQPLNAWQQFAQVLLCANEFEFID